MCCQPVHRVDCSSCHVFVAPDEVLVYADTSGREGDAVDPYHLRCFLLAADPSLTSNRALNDFVAEQAASIIRGYYNNLR